MMIEIFTDMDDIVVVYSDDLMIFTKTENQVEHNKIILELLRQLEENDLFIKPEKCTFHVTKVDFLGEVTEQVIHLRTMLLILARKCRVKEHLSLSTEGP